MSRNQAEANRKKKAHPYHAEIRMKGIIEHVRKGKYGPKTEPYDSPPVRSAEIDVKNGGVSTPHRSGPKSRQREENIH